jgi:hypothetical protein
MTRKQYSGHTSAAKINGFRAPVSFKIASNGKKLLVFQYGNTGCFVSPITGNPYASASGILRVGTIALASNGTFSVKNVKSTQVFARRA